jgi:hypothetical protein
MAPRIETEPIPPEAVKGLPNGQRLIEPINRLILDVTAALNGRLTLGNLSTATRVVQLNAPDEWVALTPENGFSDIGPASNFGSLAVLKEEGGRVRLRERVRRTLGSPAPETVIASVPTEYAPAENVLRVAGATGFTSGLYRVNTDGSIRWIGGDPTSDFTFGECSWLAADRTLPAWARPLRFTLQGSATEPRGPPTRILITGRSKDGAGLVEPPTVPAFTFEQGRPGEDIQITIPRINGLTPGVRYDLTLLVLFGDLGE